METRADDVEYLTKEIEPWVKENFWRWYKKAGLDPEDVGGSPESLNLSRFTFDALEFAFDNELKFWQCLATGEAGQVTLKDMKAMLEACTCAVCGYVESCDCDGSCIVFDCEGSCGRMICDNCRAEDEDAEIDDFICQDCYDDKAARAEDAADEKYDWMPDSEESEECVRCEKTFRYYLHDATCDDCSSYFVCKDCEMLMEGCGICGKIE